MKKTIYIFVAVCLFFTANAKAQLSGGGSSESDPYLISSEADLNTFRTLVHTAQSSGKFFKLTQNITLTAEYWEPIGHQVKGEFNATFDGDGKVISGIRINNPERVDTLGFFGFTNSGCTVKNLGLDDVEITGGELIGALGGRIGGTVTNCYATNVRITATGKLVGGLIGNTQTATSTNPIANCYATGTVSGGTSVGGLLGSLSRTSVTDSWTNIAVSATGGATGGLVGATQGGRVIAIERSFAKGSVTVNAEEEDYLGIGGLVGHTEGVANAGSAITNSYASGNVTTTNATYTGGLIGYNNKSFIINTSYASGAVSAQGASGGLQGAVFNNDGGTISINNAVAANPSITGMAAFIGRLAGSGDITEVVGYALSTMTVNGATVSDGGTNGTSKTEAELKTEATYTALGWDFSNVWKVHAGSYPLFKWEDNPPTSNNTIEYEKKALKAWFKGSGLLLVESKTTIESLSIFDISGKTVYQQDGVGKKQVDIPTDNLSNGIYIVKAVTSSGSETVKILKK